MTTRMHDARSAGTSHRFNLQSASLRHSRELTTMADLDDFFAKKDKKKKGKKKKKSAAVSADKAIEVMGPRGKAVAVTTEQAAKELSKQAAASEVGWEESNPEAARAERLVAGKEIVQMAKKTEQVQKVEAKIAKAEATGDMSFAQRALGVSEEEAAANAAAEAAQKDAAAVEEEQATADTAGAQPEPEKPALYKYKPKLHTMDRDGKPLVGRRQTFEYQQEAFPDLGAEAPKGGTGTNWSDSGGGQGGSGGGGGAAAPSSRPRLKLQKRTVPKQ
jgi:hypothetical protein